MTAATAPQAVATKGQLRAGWIVSSLIAAFMLFDAIGKLLKPKAVVDAFAQTGWPIETSIPIGIILLLCTVAFVIPRTSILGAVLLTAYLGGAVATNMRIQNPLFSHTLFPVYFGILIWIGVWLREPLSRSVFPLVNRL